MAYDVRNGTVTNGGLVQTSTTAGDMPASVVETFAFSGDRKSMSVYAPLVKVDVEKREVYGYAAIEEPDESGEIMDYASSKPYFSKWSDGARTRSGGKSLGNVREMHNPVAAGKVVHLEFDDRGKGFYIGAKVSDEGVWRKVLDGVYTGFSVGGDYVRKWHDTQFGKIRYTAKPYEISIVDAPCIPGAVFEVVKADGMTEKRAFVPGTGNDLVKFEAAMVESENPVTEEPMPENPEGDASETVVVMPEKDLPMQINPDNPPDGETLMARHFGVEEVSVADVEPMPTEANPVPQDQVFKSKIPVKPRERRVVKVRQPRMVKVK